MATFDTSNLNQLSSSNNHHTLFAHDELDSFLVQELEQANNSNNNNTSGSIANTSGSGNIGGHRGSGHNSDIVTAGVATHIGIATSAITLHSQQPSALPVLQPFDTYNPSSSATTPSASSMQSAVVAGLPSPSTAFDPRAIKATSPYYSQLMAPGTPNGNGLDVVDAVDAAGDELLDTNGNVSTLEVDVKDVPSPASVASALWMYRMRSKIGRARAASEAAAVAALTPSSSAVALVAPLTPTGDIPGDDDDEEETWRCPFGCGKVYKRSSARSIEKHIGFCRLRPASLASATVAQLQQMYGIFPSSSKRKQKKRRRSTDLAEHEKWVCPYGCGKFYRNTSTRSIHKHVTECTMRSSSTPDGIPPHLLGRHYRPAKNRDGEVKLMAIVEGQPPAITDATNNNTSNTHDVAVKSEIFDSNGMDTGSDAPPPALWRCACEALFDPSNAKAINSHMAQCPTARMIAAHAAYSAKTGHDPFSPSANTSPLSPGGTSPQSPSVQSSMSSPSHSGPLSSSSSVAPPSLATTSAPALVSLSSGSSSSSSHGPITPGGAGVPLVIASTAHGTTIVVHSEPTKEELAALKPTCARTASLEPPGPFSPNPPMDSMAPTLRRSWTIVMRECAKNAGLFYLHFKDSDPTIKLLFRGVDMCLQGHLLMDMIGKCVSLVGTIHFAGVLRGAGRRHVRYGIEDRMFVNFIDSFMWMLSNSLGTEFTVEVRDAWRWLFDVSINLMKAGAAENPMYCPAQDTIEKQHKALEEKEEEIRLLRLQLEALKVAT